MLRQLIPYILFLIGSILLAVGNLIAIIDLIKKSS